MVFPGSFLPSCCGWGCIFSSLLPSFVGGMGGLPLHRSAFFETSRALVKTFPLAVVLLWSALARTLCYVHVCASMGR